MVNKKTKLKKCFILLARERAGTDQNQSDNFLFGVFESLVSAKIVGMLPIRTSSWELDDFALVDINYEL